MTVLTQKHCVPCEGGIPPLTKEEYESLLKQVPEWRLVDGQAKIERVILTKGFKQAIDLVNKVADIANEEGHHPNIEIEFNKVKFTLWTHAINGLHENDFILASKIDAVAK